MGICRRRFTVDFLIEPKNSRHHEFKKYGFGVTSKSMTFWTQIISLQRDHCDDNVLCLLLIRTDIQTNWSSRSPLSHYLQIHPKLCTNTYTVKLHSEMFRWQPPPPPSGKTIPRTTNKAILGCLCCHAHTRLFRGPFNRELVYVTLLMYVRCKYFWTVTCSWCWMNW